MGEFADITGMKFGRLTALKRVENKGKNTSWLCKCDCGNEIEVLKYSITSGHTKSCGCLQKEVASLSRKLQKKTNTYDLSGEYGIGYTLKNDCFYFDIEDYDKIKDILWYKNNDGYILGRYDGNIVSQHRLIMNPECKNVVDHINHITWDNRKENMRTCTQQENTMNISMSKRNNSGIRGVYWNKNLNKWHVQISYKNKKIHIGVYDYLNDAVMAREEAEIKYHGEFRNKECL